MTQAPLPLIDIGPLMRVPRPISVSDSMREPGESLTPRFFQYRRKSRSLKVMLLSLKTVRVGRATPGQAGRATRPASGTTRRQECRRAPARRRASAPDTVLTQGDQA